MYHLDVWPDNGDKEQLESKSSEISECKVPMVRVQLIKGVRILPNECTIAEAELVGGDIGNLNQPLLFELNSSVCKTTKIQAMETIVSPGQEVYIPLVNYLGFTQRVDEGTEIGIVQPIEMVQPTEGSTKSPMPEQFENHPEVRSVNTMDNSTIEPVSAGRKQQLDALLSQRCSLRGMDGKQLLSLLEEYHDVFSLEEGEKGETDWVEMNIDTGDATPIR